MSTSTSASPRSLPGQGEERQAGRGVRPQKGQDFSGAGGPNPSRWSKLPPGSRSCRALGPPCALHTVPNPFVPSPSSSQVSPGVCSPRGALPAGRNGKVGRQEGHAALRSPYPLAALVVVLQAVNAGELQPAAGVGAFHPGVGFEFVLPLVHQGELGRREEKRG